MDDKRQYESVRRYFTEAELTEMHETLVQVVGEVHELRSQKAQVTTDLNAGIKSAEKRVWDTQARLVAGYETVETEVIAVMDTPRPGLKRIIRIDTNETIREEMMTPRERQSSFGFDPPAEKN